MKIIDLIRYQDIVERERVLMMITETFDVGRSTQLEAEETDKKVVVCFLIKFSDCIKLIS